MAYKIGEIYSEDGQVLDYWPISNLEEGQSSGVIRIRIGTPFEGHLRATQDLRAKVWAKWTMFPANPYIDISSGSINLSGIPGPYGEFEIYVEALSPIEVFERVPLTVVATSASPAGWDD